MGVDGRECPAVLLTKRPRVSSTIRDRSPSPGGKVDPGDDGTVGAALREAEEEIGLPRGPVEVLGTCPRTRR
jgi:hypothetical protein